MADSLKGLTVKYREGERIIAAGETGSCLFVVQAGQVKLSRRGNAGLARVEIAVLEKGDIFGEGALLEGRCYGVDAEAVTECDVLELGLSTFDRMLRGRPEIGSRVVRQLAARLDRIEQRVASATPAPAPESPLPAPEDDTPPEKPARPRAARLHLEDGNVVFPLAGTTMLLGRYDPVTEVQPEIDLSPVDTKRSVSRRHAVLNERKGTWYLTEEGGALNGTFVNGVKLLHGHGAPLTDGDIVSLGMVRLTFRES
jgi:hypothetical protein